MIIKRFYGYSRSDVFLINDNTIKVRKYGDIKRNLDQYKELSKINISIPEIYTTTPEYYDMEYIHGLDMKNFIIRNDVYKLNEFILETLEKFKNKKIKEKRYKEIYEKKLAECNFNRLGLSFSKQQLINKLPFYLPQSYYHGDFTLDNIIYNICNKRFVLIDPLSSVYDSYVFDLSKLRQDLQSKWFIRNTNEYIDDKLEMIRKSLQNIEFFNDDYLLILMLLRITNYANNTDKEFLIREIEKLWK